MHASQMYSVDEWHDFYVMVGGAAAVLTGLIFVAISIHLRALVATPLYRARARYLTGGLMLTLVTAALALVPGQGKEVLGAELITIGVLAAGTFALPVARLGRKAPSGSAPLDVRVRQAVMWASLALWVLSGVSLIIGFGGGLYILLVAVLVALNVCVGGAWSLLTGNEALAEVQRAASTARTGESAQRES